MATERAVGLLLERMSVVERSELNAKLVQENRTIHEYVGALLTAHERWDLVEWDPLPDEMGEDALGLVPRRGTGSPAHPGT